MSASGIDLADNTLAYKMRSALCVFYNTYEFVSDRSFEPGIAARDLDIGIANPGHRDSHQRFAMNDRPRGLL
jgi:hypothetical protein